jgi:hypothetical protein
MRFTIAAVIAFIAYTSTQSLAAPTPVRDSAKNTLHGTGVPGVPHRRPHHEHHHHGHHHHEHNSHGHHHHNHAGLVKAAQRHESHPVEPRRLPVPTPPGPDMHAGTCTVDPSGKDCHGNGPPHVPPPHIPHDRKHQHRKDHGEHVASSHPSPASNKYDITNPSHSHHRHHRTHGEHGHNIKKVKGSSARNGDSGVPSHPHRHHRTHGEHGHKVNKVKGSSAHSGDSGVRSHPHRHHRNEKESSDHRGHLASPPASPAPESA